jgi:Tfp pilus assembly protein PilN
VTGTTSLDLDSLVLQWNMGRREKALAMLQGHQALMDQLKAEISRLEVTGGRRVLLEHDELSRQLHRVLKAIQAATTPSD